MADPRNNHRDQHRHLDGKFKPRQPNRPIRLPVVLGQGVARWAVENAHDPATTKPRAGQYGGVGEFRLPPAHQAGLRVPQGGSMCANCRFLFKHADGDEACSEPNFARWNGSEKLPAPAEEYCSDWWQGAEDDTE